VKPTAGGGYDIGGAMDEGRVFLVRHGQTFHNAAVGESYIDVDRLSPTVTSRRGGSVGSWPLAASRRW
jgi:hypothetical protein